jgi:hypothetical protein
MKSEIIATRPNGYSGNRVTVTLSLVGTHIIETHEHGRHTCPAVSCAADMAEVEWLIDHHLNFKNYHRIKE